MPMSQRFSIPPINDCGFPCAVLGALVGLTSVRSGLALRPHRRRRLSSLPAAGGADVSARFDWLSTTHKADGSDENGFHRQDDTVDLVYVILCSSRLRFAARSLARPQRERVVLLRGATVPLSWLFC